MSLATQPSSRLRGLQYGVVAQLSAIGIINYMDRATLAIANPMIRQDMGLSVTQMGLLLSAFPLTYALAQLPLGLVIDRLGSRLLLGAGLVVWSLAQCLAGFAGTASQLWALRFMLGIGEAPTLPSSTKVVRRWFAPSKRGTPVGIFTGANYLGQAIAAPFLTLLMVGLGWRWMFIIMGLAGFVSAIVWFAVYRDCVARVSRRPQFGHIASPLREADVLRTPEFQRPVQCIDGKRDLGRSTLIGARS